MTTIQRFSTTFLRLAPIAAVVGALLLTSCSDPQKVARKQLQEKGYEVAARGMIVAAGAGDIESLRLFQEAGFEIDAVDDKGNTPLIRAAANGHLDAVEAILGMGADPRHANRVGRDALISSSGKGFADVARMLVSRGSDLSARDQEGWSALSLAAYNGHAEVVSLLSSQASPEDLDDALLVASFSGDAGVISALLGQGANINARSPESKTPLMIASEGGKIDAVRVLLQNMANPYSEDSSGRTAANLADQAGFAEVKTLILSPDQWGATEESQEVLKEMALAQQALSAEGAIEETLAPAEVANPDTSGSDRVEKAPDAPVAGTEVAEASAATAAAEVTGPARATQAAGKEAEGRNDEVVVAEAVSPETAAAPQAKRSPVPDRVKLREEAKKKPIVALNGSTIRSKTPREAPVKSMVLASFHEEPLPIAVAKVDGNRAEIRRLDRDTEQPVEVEPGQVIPGTAFEVQEVTRKFVSSKEGKGRMVDVSRVKVHNLESGATHLLVTDVAGQSSDTYAILTAPNSRYRYVVKSGDVFRTSQPGMGEKEFQVLDIRAEGVVVKDLATEEVLTIARDGVISF